jgi:hypothetical protein
MNVRQQQASRILTEADQRMDLFALVHEDDRDLLPFTAKTPGDYLTWLMIAAGRSEEEAAADPCDNGDEAQMARYRFALDCYKVAIDLLLIGIVPALPDDRSGKNRPWSYCGRSALLIKAAGMDCACPPGTKYRYADTRRGTQRWARGRFVGWTAQDARFPEHYAILVQRSAVLFIPESALHPETRALLPAPPEDEGAYAYGSVAPDGDGMS